jgi:Transposase DDE domain
MSGPKADEAIGPSLVDRARPGSKHHLLTDGNGIPLAVTLTGGNRNDVTQLIPLALELEAENFGRRVGELARLGAHRSCGARTGDGSRPVDGGAGHARPGIGIVNLLLTTSERQASLDA